MYINLVYYVYIVSILSFLNISTRIKSTIMIYG